MKSAFDRGYETGIQSYPDELPMQPYHYNQQERSEWIEGYCRGYLARWGTGKFYQGELLK